MLSTLIGCHSSGLRWADAVTTEDPDPTGPRYLRDYKEAYYRDLGDSFAASLTEAEVLQRIAQSRVLYVGDLHDDAAHHAQVGALLEALQARGLPMVLGLEAIGEDDEGDVQAYLDGRVGMRDLRTRLHRRWHDAWLDNDHVDAAFYRDLLERARAWRLPVFALEPAPRLALEQRDPIIATSVRRAAARWSPALVVVVVGQAHLLGHGRIIERVGLSSTALAGRLSVTLSQRLESHRARATHPYLLTSSGVLVRDPRGGRPFTRRSATIDPS